MVQIKSAMRGVPVVLQDEAEDGDGLAIAIPDSFKHHTLYIVGNGVVSAGAVQPEGSVDHEYAGTWAPIGGGPITVTADATQIINFEGVYRFLRVGISTPLVGGTVTVSYQGS